MGRTSVTCRNVPESHRHVLGDTTDWSSTPILIRGSPSFFKLTVDYMWDKNSRNKALKDFTKNSQKFYIIVTIID